MNAHLPFNFMLLILRAVLRNVNPMVIRILAVPDSTLVSEVPPSGSNTKDTAEGGLTPELLLLSSIREIPEFHYGSNCRCFSHPKGLAGSRPVWPSSYQY